MMRQNLGKRDRTLWIIIGIILTILSVYEITNILLQFFIAIVGILFIISGVIGWSLIYSMIGYSSKGYGIDRITKKDIEKAVKEHGVKTEPITQIKPSKIKKKVVKKATKKTTKKATKKATTPSKKVTKKITKKATKKTTKKTTKK